MILETMIGIKGVNIDHDNDVDKVISDDEDNNIMVKNTWSKLVMMMMTITVDDMAGTVSGLVLCLSFHIGLSLDL